MRGLGQITDVLSQALFPIASEAESGLDPRTVKAMQRQGLMQLGLGMMAARNQGAGLGQGLNFAFNQAQQDINQGLGQAMLARRANREDERLAMYDKRIRNQELQQDQDRLQSRIDMERNRLFQKQQFQAQQDNIATDNRLQQERFDASRRDQQKQFELQNKRLDVEAQRQRDSEMKNEKRFSSSLRKEFRTLPSVKDYEQVLPVVQSAKKAPDNGYGDLQLIYTVGKALDPNSVVREGELALTVAAGSPIQRLLGTTRFSIEKGGRLTPQLRAQILNMLDQRVGAYQQAYEKDRNQYAQYAGEQGLDPEQIVGKHALSAYDAPSSGPGRSPAGLSTGAMKYLEE